MSSKPALQTSATVDPIDINHTEKATHIYIKVDEPKGLSPRWEGPYLITSRPSRSTVEVRLGSFVDGSPRLQVYNWNTCKIAHLRPDMPDAARPKLGRPAIRQAAPQQTSVTPKETENIGVVNKTLQPAKIQTRKPQSKGPVITQEMFDKANWPEILKIPTGTRPVRSSRNPNPNYVDAINCHLASAA